MLNLNGSEGNRHSLAVLKYEKFLDVRARGLVQAGLMTDCRSVAVNRGRRSVTSGKLYWQGGQFRPGSGEFMNHPG